MSSDGFFDDDDINDAFLEEVNAIEAAHFSPPKAARPVVPPPANEDDSFDLTFDFDEEDLKKVDEAVMESYQSQSSAMTSTRKSSGHLQTTLFGEILPSSASSSKPRTVPQRVQSTSKNPFGQQAPKTKHWDHTEFAKSGLKSSKHKDKGKAKASFDFPEDEGFDESLEFEQFPAPFISVGPPPPMKLSPDLLEAKHWIYPLNRPKRDYQFNIVKHCLFDNTIVALPTGLGKTFIAVYHWFPEGKVVFVAPTKPLVAQQIDACHKTCGIPGSDAIELTGQNPKPMRHRATLINDLTSETCDARDIILIVVGMNAPFSDFLLLIPSLDEAHRATGDYAYNQVVRFLMAKNPHFRLLALTATPGGTPEAVQSLIDGLHISRIEIRDENSLDLKAYIHEKRVEQHIVPMSEEIVRIRGLLAQLMEAIRMRDVQQGQKWAYGLLSMLNSLARIMGYLVEGTTTMCYNALVELASGADADVSTKRSTAASKAKKLGDEPAFHSLMRELKAQKAHGFSMHPKMELLKGIIVQYFGEKLPNDSADETPEKSKVMVFATNRDSVDEIVSVLNAERPLIRASRFIGQGTDKQGRKGFSQREQLEVIKRFKDDEFNVLVATSIGEEGLDIGEVDLIVCYDAQKTPIRMLQRLGRTGRKRAGVVHVLLSEGREEANLDKAKDTYKNVQKTIWRGDQLELYADVERLLPDHITPQCLEKTMEIQEYIRVDGRKKSLADGSQKGTKRKRNADIQRNIPPGASTGFVPVRDLVVKGAKKKIKGVLLSQDLETAGQDDDTDRELELGMLALKRSKFTVEASDSGSTKGKGRLRKAKTMEDGPKRKRLKVAEPTLSQGVDDSDDMDIEQAFPSLLYPKTTSDSVIDLTDSDSEDPKPAHVHWSHSPKSASSNPVSSNRDRDMSWLVDDDDDDVAFDIVSSSPVQSTPKRTHERLSDDFVDFVDSEADGRPPASDVDESVQIVEPKSPLRNHQRRRTKRISGEESVHLDDHVRSSDLVVVPSSSPISSVMATKVHGMMAPPPVPSRVLSSSFGTHSPQSSSPVRPRINKGKKRARIATDSPELELPPPSQRRLHKRDKTVKKLKSDRSRPLLEDVWDMDAVHSGDEVSEGSSHSEDDVESESDRRFLEELPETQLSQSYDQSLAYRESLLSQAPVAGAGPVFAHRPVRRGPFGGRSNSVAERRAILSSSPFRDEEPDEYEMDSFVVDDDAEILYSGRIAAFSSVLDMTSFSPDLLLDCDASETMVSYSRSLSVWIAFPGLHPRTLDFDESILPSSLDRNIVAHLSTSSDTTSLHELIRQYEANSGHIFHCSLPYESRPSKSRQHPGFPNTSGDSNIVMIAHCVKTDGDHKVSLSSGFALEAPSASPGDTLFLTCAHTLEEARCDGTRGIAQKSGTFVIAGSPGHQQIHPISSIPSALPRSDLLALTCSNVFVQPGTSIRAHFVSHSSSPPMEPGWVPWVGGTWSKWVRGTVLGYRDFAGRETMPGTYEALSHLLFTPLPTMGSSGGPIIDEESGAVVGVMLGTRMDNRVEGVRGWGVPSETIFEVQIVFSIFSETHQLLADVQSSWVGRQTLNRSNLD
ncbi:hypothetical protein IW261DRAFT_1423734 [Armillaria novae-zelandiae]|uniref:ATP-dependent DNA helicase n=1 Tax=Armillaria novae-zelandiae TaxID=153914 RepID=A0AA39NWX0_9AGAR|nr:hypothetical protein IW261DRAFT_1423734 [Armillaria novae-zelandiae]